MIKKLHNYLPLFLLATLISCGSSTNKKSTYFGGKIINPKSKFVTLHSSTKTIDTLFLDEKNHFFGKINNLKEGLYYFIHGEENQYLYLEPQDSLMLRLNTWDFDESLVFAGKGANRNNVLIDCFLEKEKDEKIIYGFNNLKADNFKIKIDSLIKIKTDTYNEYLANHPEETINFKDILKITLTYPIYAIAERYPISHVKQSNAKDFPELKNTFYNYRETLDLNKDSLMFYAPYSKYIRNYLYNTTYSLGYKPMKSEYSSDFTIDLLKIISTKINPEKSKNAFLKQTIISHFYRKSSCDVNQKAFDTFFKLSSNKEDKILIKKLLTDSKTLKQGDELPNFLITDHYKRGLSIQKIIKNKNTFLFFWNPEYVSKYYISSRINFLSNTFPEVQFIQVKIEENPKDKLHRLSINNQFSISDKNKANHFLTSKMPRILLINKKGIIENGFASISSKKIYQQLKSLSKN